MARSRDDVRDDYDDEDRPRRRPRAGPESGNTTVKVIAIVGAVVLGVVVVCGGLVAVAVYSISQAMSNVAITPRMSSRIMTGTGTGGWPSRGSHGQSSTSRRITEP